MTGRRYPPTRRRRSSGLLLRASVAAVAILSCSSSVRALQPHHQSQLDRRKPSVRVPSTRLDYINLPAAPVTKEQSTITTTNEEDLQKLEQLLQLEITPDRQIPLPVELGVTAASGENSTRSPPPVSLKKNGGTLQKKRVTLKHKRNQRGKSSISSTPSEVGSPSSRLSASRKLIKRRKKLLPKKRRRTTSSEDGRSTDYSLDSVYWIRENNNNKKKNPVLLTKEEEIALTQQIRDLRAAETVRDEYLLTSCDVGDELCVSSFSEADWAAACGLESSLELRKVIRLGQEARATLVQANIGLVVNIAKKHYFNLKTALEAGNGVGTILTLQDCLQEGQIGLIKAAERFDPSRNVRFSTYATWWIRQRILGAIRDTSRIIRLPAHVHTMLMKMKKAKKIMQQEIGREPSVPELAHYMELPVEKLQQYTHASLNVVSLENPLRPTHSGKQDSRDTRTLGDTIVSDAPTPLEDAQRECLRQDLHQVLEDHLTATERAVLVARYGLEDGSSKTLEETARIVGVSRDRVRLVESKALNKLRSPQKNYRLQTYVGVESRSSSSRGYVPHVTATSTTTSSWSMADTSKKASPFDYANIKASSSAASSSSASTASTKKNRRTKMKLSRSARRGSQVKNKKLTLEQVYGGGKMNVREEDYKRQLHASSISTDNDEKGASHEMEEAASPDRLWFF